MSLLSRAVPQSPAVSGKAYGQGNGRAVDKKFYPADNAVNWEQINSLVYTFRRDGDNYGAYGDGNSAVFSCLMALSLGSIEAPLMTFRKDADGKKDPLPDDPLQQFLEDPNPDLDSVEIEFWKTWAKHCDGNAYLMKVRAGNAITGNVIEYWPISPKLMRPWTEKGSQDFIDYYRWEIKPGVYQQVPKENVIHFRLGIDDRDPRLGLSPLKRLVREIASDAEAMRFQDQLLKNYGIPGLVVEVPRDTEMTADEKRTMKQGITEAFGTENRGNVGLLTGGAAMKQFGFSPEQLNLEVLHNVPETRIASVMGVPPAVAGLGIGLEQSSNFASLRAVYEAFTERKLVPNWKMDQAKYNKWLRPDFTRDSNVVIEYDLTDVRSLQEDQDALFTRLDNAVKTGWVTPNEARSEVGLPPLSDGSGDVPMPKPVALPPGQAQPGATTPTPPTPATPTTGSKAFPMDTWAEDLQHIVDDAALMFMPEVERLQNRQKRRVKQALIGNG